MKKIKLKSKPKIVEEFDEKNIIIWSGEPLGKLIISVFEITGDGIYNKIINEEEYKIKKVGNLIYVNLVKKVSV